MLSEEQTIVDLSLPRTKLTKLRQKTVQSCSSLRPLYLLPSLHAADRSHARESRGIPDVLIMVATRYGFDEKLPAGYHELFPWKVHGFINQVGLAAPQTHQAFIQSDRQPRYEPDAASVRQVLPNYLVVVVLRLAGHCLPESPQTLPCPG